VRGSFSLNASVRSLSRPAIFSRSDIGRGSDGNLYELTRTDFRNIEYLKIKSSNRRAEALVEHQRQRRMLTAGWPARWRSRSDGDRPI